MGKTPITARITALPLRHKLASVSPLFIALFAVVFYSAKVPKQNYGSVTLSFDASQVNVLTSKTRGEEAPGVNLARSILDDEVMASLAANRELNAKDEKEEDLASLRSRLAIAEVPGSKVRLVWTSRSASEASAVAQRLTHLFISWVPDGISRIPPSSRDEPVQTRDAQSISSSAPLQQTKEIDLLQLSITFLDSRTKELKSELTFIGSGDGSASGHREGRRTQIVNQIHSVRNQRILILDRLREARDERRALEKTVAGKGPQTFKATEAAVGNSFDHGALPLERKSPFVSADPASYFAEVFFHRLVKAIFEFFAGLASGCIYLVVVLYSFRPVRNVSQLKELLPRGVHFIGNIPEN